MKNVMKTFLMAAVVLSATAMTSTEAEAGIFCRQPVRTALRSTVCRVKTCQPVRTMLRKTVCRVRTCQPVRTTVCNTSCRVRTCQPVRTVLRRLLPPYGCCNSGCASTAEAVAEPQKAPAPKAATAPAPSN